MNQTLISEIEIRDFNAIKDISDHVFGSNYITLNQLNSILAIKNIQFKITLNSKLIGFCLTSMQDAKDIAEIFPGIITLSENIALIKTIAIHPEYQRKNFGSLLLKKVIKSIKQQNVSSEIYYPSWVEPKSEAFTKLLKNEGFIEYKTFLKYWHQISMISNFGCVKCGNPPCSCSMKLFVKK